MILGAIHKKIIKLKKIPKFRKKHKLQILDNPVIRSFLNNLHNDFALVPTDKASNNIAIICKKFYIEMLLREVGYLDNKLKQDISRD